MRIPTRLDEKIRELYEVQAWVSGAIADFEPWLKDSKCVFFPDYTDHGNDHVEQILITASSIIRDEAWEVMTPEDAGILVIATLLHDCAMHLTEEGFLRLIKGETHQEAIKDFNDASWKDLWKQFISSAKRFDDKQLQAIFGNTEPVEDPAVKNPDKMDRRDRKLIGEFLRRYHPRLAHEIALLGVPSPDKLKPGEEPLQLPKKLGRDFADIAGLVARSHGMPLRATFEYLKRYDLREYGKVHAVFLMAVLRIADYLQIQAERAPRQTLRVKDIRSSISRREWDVHQSIRGIRSIGDDPEAIFIQTEHRKPDNVNTYLRLKEWLNGIQSELDACWAVFGEVYARTNLQPLGLMLRRVRSNLDNEEQFFKSVQYVPKKVRFEVARNEVLQRLVGPLYGNKVEVGIRELIQNSVDAVRELEDSLRDDDRKLQEIKHINLIEELNRIGLLNVKLNNDNKGIEKEEQEKQNKFEKYHKRIKNFAEIKDADVLVLVQEPEDERKNGKLIICDRGSGMTEQIITDYFLKVGASLRNSDIWAEQHEDEPKNENLERKSRVARSGYFGVGGLAAYLLGDKIKVYTRHFTQQIGIEFEARLGDEAIELRYSQGELPIGTIIEIDITQETLDKLGLNSKYYSEDNIYDWDWYCLDEPKLLRLFIDKNRNFYSLKQNTIIKLKENNMLKEGWHEIKDTKFKKAYFNILDDSPIRGNTIICNGIRANCSLVGEFFNNIFISSSPAILVLDTDRQLEFELTRSRAKLGVDIETKIHEMLFKYFLIILFINSPKLKTSYDFKSYISLYPLPQELEIDQKSLIIDITRKIEIAISDRHPKDKSLILYTSKGILINGISLLMKFKIKKMLVVYLPNLKLKNIKSYQVYNRKEYGTSFDEKCKNLSSIGFFKVNYFDLLAISNLGLENDMLAVDIIPTYPSKFTSLKGIQTWILQKTLNYKNYYNFYVQSMKFVYSTNLENNHQGKNRKEEFENFLDYEITKIKEEFNKILDSEIKKIKEENNDREKQGLDKIEIINWIESNLYIEKEPGLITFCIGENSKTETDFRLLHSKVKEVSEQSINIKPYGYDNTENFLKKNLLKRNQGQDNIKDIITVEISFNENVFTDDPKDESIVKLWIEAFGEEVIPYQDTPEYQSKINSDKLTVLKEYIDELEKINFLEED